MPGISGTYNINVPSAPTLNGALVVSADGNSATFKGPNNAAANFNGTCGSVSWDYTDGSNITHHFTGGSCNAGPPKTLTGGKVNLTSEIGGGQDVSWDGTGTGNDP